MSVIAISHQLTGAGLGRLNSEAKTGGCPIQAWICLAWARGEATMKKNVALTLALDVGTAAAALAHPASPSQTTAVDRRAA